MNYSQEDCRALKYTSASATPFFLHAGTKTEFFFVFRRSNFRISSTIWAKPSSTDVAFTNSTNMLILKLFHSKLLLRIYMNVIRKSLDTLSYEIVKEKVEKNLYPPLTSLHTGDHNFWNSSSMN